MVEWIKKAMEERKEHDSNEWYNWKLGENNLVIDLTKEPIHRDVDRNGRKVKYHDFTLLGPDTLGMKVSCSDYLYYGEGGMLDKLSTYADKNCSVANIIVEQKKTAEGKVSWSVFVKEVK